MRARARARKARRSVAHDIAVYCTQISETMIDDAHYSAYALTVNFTALSRAHAALFKRCSTLSDACTNPVLWPCQDREYDLTDICLKALEYGESDESFTRARQGLQDRVTSERRQTNRL